MNFIWVNLQQLWRAMRHSPSVALAIVAMLALGTGGVTVVFNPIYSQIFAPLPFPQDDKLVRIGGDIPLFNINFNRFERREELDRIFSNLTAYAPSLGTSITLPGTGKNVVVYDVDVSEEFFETLGVLPLRGSDFKHSVERRAVVVSDSFWRNELLGADDAIGMLIQIFDTQYSIVGIMPETFDFPNDTDIWTYRGETEVFSRRTRQYLGRLRTGISFGRASEELRALEFKSGEGLSGNSGPVVQSLRVALYGDRQPMLVMLGSASVLFLLLVCAGVMNLLVTQGTLRKSEIAIRLIHGASRWNLVFQLLCEMLPLVIAGSLVGAWLSKVASMWLTAEFPALQGGEVDFPVKIAFFSTLVLTVTIIGGLTPALYATGIDLNMHLKSGSNFKWRLFSLSLRELLVGVQLSLSLVLLTGLGLLVNSLMFHVDVPISWSSRDMVVVQAELLETPIVSRANSFAEAQKLLKANSAILIEAANRRAMFFQEFHNQLHTMPEVTNVGIFNPIPFSSEAIRMNPYRQGVYRTRPLGFGEVGEDAFRVDALSGNTSPEGFDLLEISLIAGRPFSQMDMDDALKLDLERFNHTTISSGVGTTAIINQSLARKLWPGDNAGNAVGKTIYSQGSHEIIGVVRDFHTVSNNKDFVPAIYRPESNTNTQIQTFLVKLHSELLMKDFRHRLFNFDINLAIIKVHPLREIVSVSTANMRMTLQLLGCFALLGIVVAGLSAYAITSLMVIAMNREIGIRMAMGAATGNIFRLILWRGIRTILFALPIGLFLAWILSRILSGFLFQVKVDDPLAWIISCAALIGIAGIAVLIPALRAIRVNPLDAMRNE